MDAVSDKGDTGVLFNGGVKAMDATNCAMSAAIKAEINECFQSQGIEINLPSFNSKSSVADARKMYGEALMEPEQFCGRQEQLKPALVCAANKSRSCMKTTFHGYLVSDDAMLKAVDLVCSSQEVDFPCVKSKQVEIFDCAVKRAGEHLTKDMNWQVIVCKAYELHAMCQRQVFTSCGCLTTKFHYEMTLGLLYPSACPVIKPRPRIITCNPTNPQAFVDMGDGAEKPSWNWMLLLFVSLGAAFSSRFE